MNQQDIAELDEIINKQIKLENLLETTKSPAKNIYKMQLKTWISLYQSDQMPFAAISLVLDNRIRELENLLAY